jgi:hypothetical protein
MILMLFFMALILSNNFSSMHAAQKQTYMPSIATAKKLQPRTPVIFTVTFNEKNLSARIGFYALKSHKNINMLKEEMGKAGQKIVNTAELIVAREKMKNQHFTCNFFCFKPQRIPEGMKLKLMPNIAAEDVEDYDYHQV